MIVLNARNVHDALPRGILTLLEYGDERESRAGAVRVARSPVTTVYQEPLERVIFWPERDANPFFHFFEALWMLNGRNDLEFVENFAKNMRSFSDDGETLNGAYGYRWRHHFQLDQISWAIEKLRQDPNDRRIIISMWDGILDTQDAHQSKDVPCNLNIHFQIGLDGCLNMTIFNRSNDIIWGAYGANAVHFSYLQEYVATALKVPVGRYWQVSDNYHAYKSIFDTVLPIVRHAQISTSQQLYFNNPYTEIQPYKTLFFDEQIFNQELELFMHEGPIIGFREPFFRKVVTPLWNAHRAFKENSGKEKYSIPLEILQQCKAADWKKAAEEWIQRRAKKAGYTAL